MTQRNRNLLALTACGGDGETKDPVENQVEETDDTQMEDASANTDDTADDSNVPPEEPLKPEEAGAATETESKPASGNQGGVPAPKPETPAEKPAETPDSKPVEKPAEEPDTTAVDLAEFYAGLSDQLPAMMSVEGETLESYYPGLADIAARQCLVYYAAISASVGEIALVEVESADDVQAVKDIFQARIDYQVGDETNPGGAWYPASIEGWKNNSRIVSNGNYVMLVAADGADDIVSAFNALFA